jgi:hypothetical protein
MAAQQPPVLTRTDLQQHDLSAPGREVVQNIVEIGPESPAIKHRHPGEEISPTSSKGRSRRRPRERHVPVAAAAEVSEVMISDHYAARPRAESFNRTHRQEGTT